MLSIKDPNLYEKAKRLRWFGIDRSSKQKGTWENDLRELGYKYQMTDLSACLGLSALKHLTNLIQSRRSLLHIYKEEIAHKELKVINVEENEDDWTCPWLCTFVERGILMKKLKNAVERQVRIK